MRLGSSQPVFPCIRSCSTQIIWFQWRISRGEDLIRHFVASTTRPSATSEQCSTTKRTDHLPTTNNMDDPDDYDPFQPHPLSPDPSSPPLIRNANSVPGPSTSPTKRTSKSLSSETIKTEKKGGGSSHGGTQVNDSPAKVEEERKNGRPGKRVKLSRELINRHGLINKNGLELSYPTANTETQSQDVQSALNQLLSSGLTLPRIIQLSVRRLIVLSMHASIDSSYSTHDFDRYKAIPDPPPAFEPICESTTLEQCRKVRSACPYVSVGVPALNWRRR